MTNIAALSDAAIFAGLGTIGIIVVFVALGLLGLSVFVSVYQWVVIYRVRKANRQKAKTGLTSEQVARNMLDGLGYTETKVEKLGFWGGLFVGNHYNEKKDIIYISKALMQRSTLAAIAIVGQKVAEVEAFKSGDKKIAKRSRIQRSGVLAPIVFIPLVVVGIILDALLARHTGSFQFGIFTIILTALALAYFIYGLVGMGLTIKIEKASAAKAMEYFSKTNVLDAEERKDVEKLYKTLITSYIINYIYMLLQVIRLIFKLLGLLSKISSKK